MNSNHNCLYKALLLKEIKLVIFKNLEKKLMNLLTLFNWNKKKGTSSYYIVCMRLHDY